MPSFTIIGFVVLQVLLLHNFGRVFLKREADTYWGIAAFAGFAAFATYHERDGLPIWPAAPLLIVIALVTYYLSIRFHRRFDS